MQRKFSHFIHVPGALGADMDVRFTVPSDCQLVHVSAVASNDSAALLTLGPSTNLDGYLESTVIGDSQVPTEFDLDDFVDDEYPHIVDGTIFCVTLDYDGDGGTAANDFTLVLTFTEG